MFGRMQELVGGYGGMIEPAIPELDIAEQAATANLVFNGVEQMAMRIASVQPQVIVPALVPGQRKSESYARVRRLAILAWWDQNHFDRKQRKRARTLISYGMAPVIMRPDTKLEIPRWHLTDPFGTFPGKPHDEDSICVPDCIIKYERSLEWLQEHYPEQTAGLEKGGHENPDILFDILEWVDDDEHVLIAMGKDPEMVQSAPWMPAKPARASGLPEVELVRYPNVVGRCPVIYPTRIGLNGVQGQFDGMPALARHQARAMALMQVATERAIFPEIYLIARPNEQVQLISAPDGRAGEPGEVQGGDVKEMTIAPPPQIQQYIEYLERNQRVTGGLSSDFGGEAPSSVRTGRAGEQLLGETVNYWIQEAQETLGLAYRLENELAFDFARELWGSKKKSFYVNYKNANAPVDYIPDVHFESSYHQVAWPNPGSDAANLAIGLGQRMGTGEISKRTARELDPYVQDAELEERRVTDEALDNAMLASIEQAVAQGQLGPLEVAQIKELVGQGRMDLESAIQKAHQAQQKQQQAQQDAAAQQQAGAPGDASQQPGIMAPGLANQLGQGAGSNPGQQIGTPPPDLTHMATLFSALRPRQDNAPPGPGVAGAPPGS